MNKIIMVALLVSLMGCNKQPESEPEPSDEPTGVTAPSSSSAEERATATAGTAQAAKIDVAKAIGGKRWRLTTIDGRQPEAIAWLEFDKATGSFRGSTGCNQLAGGISSADGKLNITRVAATKRACTDPAGIMDQEQIIVACLQGLTNAWMSGAELMLEGDGWQLAFEAQ